MERLQERLQTGVSGLDTILSGGLIRQRAYLVRGGPGQGKTTLGLQYLSAANTDERALFIGFQEPEEEIRINAAAVGIDVSRIVFLSLIPDEQFFTEQQGYDVFSSAEVEQEPLAEAIVQAVKEHAPTRVFVDSLTQLRFLSEDPFQYRKQVLSFLRFLTRRGITVLFSSESSKDLPDDDLQFMADGVINFETHPSGAAVRVSKFRGSGFLRDEHHMSLGEGGVKIFPRMSLAIPCLFVDRDKRWSSGAASIDAMLDGGLEAGTITLITGPSGVGKSTLAAQFAAEATRTGARAALFLFEEEVSSYLRRTESLGVEFKRPQQEGALFIEMIEPMRYLADEFTSLVRERIEQDKVELVILDSISGFSLTLGGEGVQERLHTFAKALARMGVTVLLVNETQAITGQEFHVTERGISYLSDNVVFLRYVETQGQLSKAFGVLKKRLGSFDNSLRTYDIGSGGLVLHDGVEGLNAVLSGMPTTTENG